jgi:transposase
VPDIWLPDPRVRRERELARFRLHLVKHRSMLKHRIHSTLINFGKPCPVSDLFGRAGRELLGRLELPAAWRQSLDPSLHLIDQLELQLAEIQKQLRAAHPDHPYVPLLMTVPGIGWVLAYTIAAPRSATSDASRRRPSARATPGSARRSSSRATPTAAARSPSTVRSTCAGRCSRRRCTRSATPAYAERYQRTKHRHGKQRGAKVAQVEIARRPTRAIWRCRCPTRRRSRSRACRSGRCPPPPRRR